MEAGLRTRQRTAAGPRTPAGTPRPPPRGWPPTCRSGSCTLRQGGGWAGRTEQCKTVMLLQQKTYVYTAQLLCYKYIVATEYMQYSTVLSVSQAAHLH